MRTILGVVLLATFGCGTDPLGPGFVSQLTRFGGCVDVVFFAVDDADKVMVRFEAEGLVAAAYGAGTETSSVIDLPSAGVELTIRQGTQVSDATCDDVIENQGPVIDRTWVAQSGTATVTIRPLGNAEYARGDLRLQDVVFTSSGGGEVVLTELGWTDVFVGWLPG
jgi:hypothetical protein